MSAPFRFILLCHQRSGSNALGAILNADDRVGLYGQLFNPFFGYWKRNRKWGLPTYAAHPEALRHFGLRPPMRPVLERRFVAAVPGRVSVPQVADAFWARYRPDCDLAAKGYKLHDYQVSDADLATLATGHADGVVMLARDNLLKAAVSWAYAIKTDVWSSKRRTQGPPPVHRLDLRELAWFIEKTAGEVGRWRRTLADAGANWIEMNYERDVETRDFGKLYRFLDLGYDGPPEFVTRRLSTPDYAHVENAREIEDQLGSDTHGRLFG